MTEEDLDLYASAVLHEGFTAVDEEGTEAAAATAVVMPETSASPSNQDTNRLRFWLEKGTDLSVHTPADLPCSADTLTSDRALP